jgi:hypothetical protein
MKRTNPSGTELLEEFSTISFDSLHRGATTAFETELGDLENFHLFLLEIDQIEDSTVRQSYAELSHQLSAPHESWFSAYRRLYAEAVERLIVQPEAFSRLLRTPRRLLSKKVIAGPPAIAVQIMNLTSMAVYFLQRWRSRHVPSVDAQLSDDGRSAVEIEAYENAVEKVIESWEGTWYFISPRDRTGNQVEYWQDIRLKWPLIFGHLQVSAEFMVRAAWNGDSIGFTEYLDHYLRWPNGNSLRDRSLSWLEGAHELRLELIAMPWNELRSNLSTSFPNNGEKISAKAVYETILKNTRTQVRHIAAQLILSWWLEERSDQFSLIAAGRVLLSKPSSGEKSELVLGGGKRLFEDLFYGALASADSAEAPVDRKVGESLDSVTERLDAFTERRVKAGRVFSPSTKHGRYELRQALRVMLVTFYNETGSKRVYRTIMKMANRDFGVGSSEYTLDSLQSFISHLDYNSGPWDEKFEQAAATLDPSASYDQNVLRLNDLLVRLRTGIESVRASRLMQILASGDVLKMIALSVDDNLRQIPGQVPIFSRFVVGVEALKGEPQTYKLTGVDKAFLTSPPLKDGADVYLEGVAKQISSIIVRRVFSSFRNQPRQQKDLDSGPDTANFWKSLKELSSDIDSPSLAISSVDYSTFIYSDLAETISASNNTSRVFRDDVASSFYVTTVEGIDIYVVGNDHGRATLFSSNNLRELIYSPQDQDRIISLQFEDSESDPAQGAIVFQFHQEIKWGHEESILLTFPSSEVADATT